jgi:PAS domain S-box-containing protein
MSFKKNPLDSGELHRLARQQFAPPNEQGFSELSPEQVQQLLEDLAVSKIELEIQNAHLNEARSQLELALNQARELYDFSPVGSFSVDHAGTIVKLNLAGARLLGQERVHLLGSRLDQFFSDADRASLHAMLHSAEKSGDVQHGDLSVLGKGGSVKRVRAEIGPLGHGLGCNVVLLDITERSLLEQRLLENEARWKFALGASGDCVWDWNVQAGTVSYSPQFEQLYGFSVQELGASLENWSSRIHPEDRQQVMASLQKCLTGQTDSYSNEHRGLTKDGSWKWILARGAVFARAGDGSAVRILGTQVDITDRKTLEETLRTTSALHRVVFDALPVKLVVLDRNGRIVQTNSAWNTYVRNNGVPGHYCEAGAEYAGALTAMMGGGAKHGGYRVGRHCGRDLRFNVRFHHGVFLPRGQ